MVGILNKKAKKRISYLWSLLLFLLIACFIFVPKMTEFLDKVLLMENKYTYYWHSLLPQSNLIYYISPNTEVKGGTGNLIVYREKVLPLDSIGVYFNNEGAFSINGFNKGMSQYVFLTPDGFYLPPGEYSYSLSKERNDPDIYSFVESYDQYQNKHIWAEIKSGETSTFSLEKKEYINIVLHIPEGDYLHNRYKPELLFKQNSINSNVSYSEKTDSFYAVRVTHVNNLENEELSLYKRYLYYCGTPVSWTSIVDDSGYGIQLFKDGSDASGLIDSLGRVIE